MIHQLIANILPFFPEKLIWIFSKRYVAGTTIEDGLRAAGEINREGMEVTVDLLGERIHRLEQAEENKQKYLHIIDRFTAEGVCGNFSVKPTMFGLLLSEEICTEHIEELVVRASEKGSFIRIDMEDSTCVDGEIRIYNKLRCKYSENVGLVFQSYMRRTLNDLKSIKENTRDGCSLNFRLCKGIYNEPEHIAFKDYDEIRAHYLKDLEWIFDQGIYVGIATHDKYLLGSAIKMISEKNISKDKYEFQMLYGVTPESRKDIVMAGHKMRIYIPFGEEWFAYSTRRLKENPKMVFHIIKALFVRG